MNIFWTDNIWQHTGMNAAWYVCINNYYANVCFSDDGDLYIEDHARGMWPKIDCAAVMGTTIHNGHTHDMRYTVTDTSVSSTLDSVANTMDSAIDTIKGLVDEKDKIVKIISQIVNNDGDIVELIVRKPRSEDERSEINERIRASKARDTRRSERESEREAEGKVPRIVLCGTSSS